MVALVVEKKSTRALPKKKKLRAKRERKKAQQREKREQTKNFEKRLFFKHKQVRTRRLGEQQKDSCCKAILWTGGDFFKFFFFRESERERGRS